MRLEYGHQQFVPLTIPAEHLASVITGPPAMENLVDSVRSALHQPAEFPPLRDAIVPGDRVVIALDRDMPHSDVIVRELWDVLAARDVSPADVTILNPADWRPPRTSDPRGQLPDEIRPQVTWKSHDPTNESVQGYLGSTAAGERIYLSRELLEADVVLPVCRTMFAPLTGYRHAASLIYPGFSNSATLAKLHGQGHSELSPEDERPIRQAAEEVLWMLGVQFVVQTVPASSNGESAAVFAGSPDAVARNCRELLNAGWRVGQSRRVETVVVSLTHGGEGSTWDDVGTALEVARSLVKRGGRIVLLSDLKADFGPGLEILRESRIPRDALTFLRQQSPPDLISATQVALAADHAPIYFLSRLSSPEVEDHFLIPLENPREVARLLETITDGLVIQGAQFAFGEVTTPG